ncbi:MAG: ECF transporter S component [Clostridium sp.]|nr:ECF transporter S component [Clostridium sp.]
MNQDVKTKKLTAVAMLCAVSYLMVVVGRIPIVMFLDYEPKDVMITIGGFIFGPWTAMVISVIVCFIEMISISSTGIIGCIMNILSSCCFACPAAWNYKRDHTVKGAALGLFFGIIASTAAMLLWNYLLTPLYMGYPREAVAAMLAPVFLPFNLFKGGLNMAVTLLLYKPIVTALRKTGLVPPSIHSAKQQTTGIALTAFMIILTCVLLYLVMTGKFL